jgi:hypothetical protein
MRSRPLTVLTALACLNLAVFGICYCLAANDHGGSFEGLVPALIAYATLFFSVVLAGLAWNTGLAEVRQGASVPRAFLCTLLAAAPLLFYVFLVLLPLKLRARHGGEPNLRDRGGGRIASRFHAGGPQPGATHRGRCMRDLWVY